MSRQSFVVDRGPGGWGNAIAIPGLVAPLNQGEAAAVSVSCAAVDDCSATGTYEDGSGLTQGFVVDRGPGGWGNAIAIPGLTAVGTSDPAVSPALHFPVSVDCATAGSCVVAGYYYGPQGFGGFVADRTSGTWTSAIAMAGLPGTPVTVLVNQVACADASTCAVIGSLFDPSAPTPRWEAFLNQRTGGTWGTVASVPGLSALGGEVDFEHLVIACVRNGNCVSGGGHSVTPSTAPPYAAFLTRFVPMSSTTTTASSSTSVSSTSVPGPTTTAATEPVEPRYTG